MCVRVCVCVWCDPPKGPHIVTKVSQSSSLNHRAHTTHGSLGGDSAGATLSCTKWLQVFSVAGGHTKKFVEGSGRPTPLDPSLHCM